MITSVQKQLFRSICIHLNLHILIRKAAKITTLLSSLIPPVSHKLSLKPPKILFTAIFLSLQINYANITFIIEVITTIRKTITITSSISFSVSFFSTLQKGGKFPILKKIDRQNSQSLKQKTTFPLLGNTVLLSSPTPAPFYFTYIFCLLRRQQ